MTWTACQMFEVPRSCEVIKLLGAKLWAIVTDYLVWNAIPSKMILQLENSGNRFGI